MHKLRCVLKGLCAAIAVVGYSGTSALAEQIVTAEQADVGSSASVRNWSVELNATMLGSYNENTFHSAKLGTQEYTSGGSDQSRTNGVSSDLGLDIAVRKSLSESLLTGIRINLASGIAEDRQDRIDGYTPVLAYVNPITWTLRYQRVGLLSQSFFTPWIEAEAGVSVLQAFNTEANPSGRNTYIRPSARGSLGFDIRPWAGGRFFMSARASYLAVNEFSNSQFGVGSGISF